MERVRHVQAVHSGTPTIDGAGVKLTRMIGTPALDTIDPFLMLDQIDSDEPESYIAGFPDHPHRGFETVTIMLEGRMRHRDSVGNDGLLRAGDVQWMTAGRGIIHSEVPEMVDGRLSGFQLWVNLPANKKMMRPRYQDIKSNRIPMVHVEGCVARVIAGSYLGETGPAEPQTPIRLMDVRLEPGAEWTVTTDPANDMFMCIYEGTVHAIDSGQVLRKIGAPSTVLFAGKGGLEVVAGSDGAAILYCEGEPIREPVVKYGPFVMNTHEELRCAVHDFNAGTLAGP
ncbi:MAG: pirin family protein [Pseudomonadota bacterium]|nr:pirin family protein [Pseudomonadota bacterium]